VAAFFLPEDAEGVLLAEDVDFVEQSTEDDLEDDLEDVDLVAYSKG